MTVFGIDVSKWQGGISWEKVPSNIEFAIARASYGAVRDPWYAANAKGIRATGRLPGAYHFLYSGDGRGQADVFLDTVGDPAGCLCVVDVEAFGTTIADVNAFVDRFKERAPNHPLIVYTGKWFWASNAFGNPQGNHIGPLWHSRYVDESLALGKEPAEVYPKVPSLWWNTLYGGWATATILQFSSSTSVPGISGRCDADAFRGTLADLRKLAAPPEENPLLTATNPNAADVKLAKGTQVYDLNGQPLVKMSSEATVRSVGQSGDFDVVVITTGGVRQFLLVKTSTILSRVNPVEQAVKALEADLATAAAKISAARAALL